MLRVEKLNAWYGSSHVLQDVNLEVDQGEIVCLIGRNGAGKTTTLKSIIGLVEKTRGSAVFKNKEMLGQAAHVRFGLGLAYVPEERRIVQGLTVRENLRLGLVASPLKKEEAARIQQIAEIFPRLAERLDQEAITMSGGEQQMLAIARALVRDPKIILLDEPFEGLAPVIVRDLVKTCQALAEAGQTILLVEQNIAAALTLASRAYIVNNGHVAHEGPTSEIKVQPELLQRHLGI